MVTRMEMQMRTMMIHVWSVPSPANLVRELGSFSRGEKGKVYGERGKEGVRRTRHFVIGDRVGQHLGEVEEHAAPLVEDLDARLDLEVLAHGDVQRVQRGLALPEEVGDVEDIACFVSPGVLVINFVVCNLVKGGRGGGG